MKKLPRTIFGNLRTLPRPLWILFAGTFVNRFGSFVMPFLVLHLTRHGISIADAGLAVAAYGVGHLLASIIGGHLADIVGRRNTIAISMFAGAATMLALSLATAFPAILLLTVLVGLASELYRPASSALIADLAPAESRVTAYAVYRLAINAGFAFGPASAGFLAEHSFQWLFWGDALTSILFGMLALWALPHGLRRQGKLSHWREDFTSLSRDRRFLLFLCALSPITFVFFQIGSTFPLQLQVLGFSPAAYGLLISLNGLLIIIFELPLTAWSQRLPPRQVIATGYLLLGIGFALTGIATKVPALIGTIMIWTFGEMISAPISVAYIAGMAPESLRGRYMGLYGLTWSLGLIAGPALGTRIFARDPGWLWSLCGGLGLISALMVLGSGRAAQKEAPSRRELKAD